MDTVESKRRLRARAKLLIDTMRLLRHPDDSEYDGNDVLITMAVLAINLDGQPASTAKIAAELEIPRTTVMRRLARLESVQAVIRVGASEYQIAREHAARIAHQVERAATLADRMRRGFA